MNLVLLGSRGEVSFVILGVVEEGRWDDSDLRNRARGMAEAESGVRGEEERLGGIEL